MDRYDPVLYPAAGQPPMEKCSDGDWVRHEDAQQLADHIAKLEQRVAELEQQLAEREQAEQERLDQVFHDLGRMTRRAERAEQRLAELEQVAADTAPSVYGYCPHCWSRGVSRERRLNGNDRCEHGHVYPSSAALTDPGVE